MSDTDLAQILRDAKTIAVVGASADPARSSNGIMAFLQRAGYKTIPVNPNEAEVLGERAYPSLADIPAGIRIDIVDVFRRAEHTPDIARQAVAAGAGTLWLQSGIVNEDAMRIARAGGLNAVQDTCIAVAHRLHGIAPK